MILLVTSSTPPGDTKRLLKLFVGITTLSLILLSILPCGVESRYRERTEPLPSDAVSGNNHGDELARIRRHFQQIAEFDERKSKSEYVRIKRSATGPDWAKLRGGAV